MIEVWLIVIMFYPLNVVFIFALKTYLERRNVLTSIVKSIYIVLNWVLPFFIILFAIIYWSIGLLQHALDQDAKNYC